MAAKQPTSRLTSGLIFVVTLVSLFTSIIALQGAYKANVSDDVLLRKDVRILMKDKDDREQAARDNAAYEREKEIARIRDHDTLESFRVWMKANAPKFSLPPRDE